MIQERLRNHHARINSNHDSISDLRDKQATQDTKIAVIHTELRETREDISEMHEDFTSQLVWVRRGLWAAASTFTVLILMLAALIVQAVTA